MATEAIQSEYQILFNNAVKSVNTFINTLDAKLSKAGDGAGADISNKIERGFDGLGGRLGRIFDTAFGTVLGGAIQNGLGQINNLLTTGFDATINFDAQISSIKALTGATGVELEKIRSASLQAGKDTKFSALEAAQGFEELLKAGVSLDAILGGGLTGALDLAVAGELSVADAAEIASTGLNTFAKDGLSVTRVADLLAGTANASATNVSELKFALSSVGVVSAQASQSLESTSTALGIFAQNGLKGSDAGTSLKTFLNNLIPTTKSATGALERLGIVQGSNNKFINSATGKFKSLSEISQILNDSTKNLTDSQKSLALETIFGSDAVRAAGILAKSGSVEFTKFNEAINKVKAADVAKERLNNLKGAFETLKGSIETNQILLLSGLQPALLQLTKGFDGLINSIDFAKAGESISNFVSVGIKELGNLYNLLFKGDYTGLFGLGEDSKVIGFLLDIRNAFISVKDLIINTNFSLALPDFSPLLESISGLGSSIIPLIDKIGNSDIFKTIVSTLGQIGSVILEIGLPALIDFISNLFDLISNNKIVLDTLLIGIAAIGVALLISTSPITFIIGLVAGLYLAYEKNFLGIQNITNIVINFVIGLFNTLVSIVTNIVKPFFDGFVIFWSAVFESIKIAVATGFLIIVGLFTGNFGLIIQAFDNGRSAILNIWGGLLNSLGSTIANAFSGIINAFVNGFNTVRNFLSGINLSQIGINLVQGLINGIAGSIGGIYNTLAGGITSAIDGAKKLLGINSPSKVFMEIGGFTGQGLLLGLEKYTPELGRAFDNLVNVPQIPPVPTYNPLSNINNNQNSQTNINNTQSTNSNNSSQTNINYGNNYNLFPVNQYSF